MRGYNNSCNAQIGADMSVKHLLVEPRQRLSGAVKTHNRPHVVLKISESIDGRITFGPNLTQFDRHPAETILPDVGPLEKKIDAMIESDWKPQGIMVGSRTVMREGDKPCDLPPADLATDILHTDFLPNDVVAQTTRWLVLVDGAGRGRSGYKGTETPGSHMIHLVSHDAPDVSLAFLRRERIPYLIGGRRHVDLVNALGKLHAKLGIRAITLWGGGTLNGVLLRLGLIDEIHLVIWPVMIGGTKTPTLADCMDLGPNELPTIFELLHTEPQDNGLIWLHYRVRRNHPE